MKRITAEAVRENFDGFLDNIQQEPIAVTRDNQLAGIMLSVHEYETMYAQAEKEMIRAGIIAGLEDSKAGRGEDLNAEFVARIKKELQDRIDARNKAK